jgi:hypothetical protein
MATRSTTGRAGTPHVGESALRVAAKDRGNVEVDQCGSGKVLSAKTCTRVAPVRAAAGQRDHQNTGVNDEHGHHAPPSLLR